MRKVPFPKEGDEIIFRPIDLIAFSHDIEEINHLPILQALIKSHFPNAVLIEGKGEVFPHILTLIDDLSVVKSRVL